MMGTALPWSCPEAKASAAAIAPAAAAIPKTIIAPDLSVTQVIKGCWQLSGGHRGDDSTDRTAGQKAVEDFSKFYNAGITSWDCADHYGPAELLIGRCLEENPEQAPNIQVLTKLCVFTSAEMSSLNKGYINRAVGSSLSKLGQPRVDLMQFYWGDYDQPRYPDAVKYLGDMQAEGKIGHIGVTNFDVARMQKIVDTGVKVATNQLQYSLLDTRPENITAQFCATNDIKLLPYGVLAGGFLSEKYLDAPINSVKIDTSSKGKYARVIFERGGWKWFQSLLTALDTVAKKHGSNIPNVASRWVLDKPGVAGVILGARNANHLDDHVALFNLKLDDDDRGLIQEVLDKGKKPKGDCYQWERGLGQF